jgi:hypothetical protein
MIIIACISIIFRDIIEDRKKAGLKGALGSII